jgi:hypothetical protein
VAGSGLQFGYARLQDNPECLNPQELGGFGRGTPGAIAKLTNDEPYGPVRTVTIAAGRRQYIHLWISQGGVISVNCNTTVAFDPVADKQYELVFDATSRQCSAVVFRTESATGSRTIEESAQKASRQCFMF